MRTGVEACHGNNFPRSWSCPKPNVTPTRILPCLNPPRLGFALSFNRRIGSVAYKMRRILQCGISFVCSWSQRPPTISVGFALVCGSLVHFRVVGPLFDAMNLIKRNLFEASIVCFLICMASELRALVPDKNEVSSGVPSIVKRQVAA